MKRKIRMALRAQLRRRRDGRTACERALFPRGGGGGAEDIAPTATPPPLHPLPKFDNQRNLEYKLQNYIGVDRSLLKNWILDKSFRSQLEKDACSR